MYARRKTKNKKMSKTHDLDKDGDKNKKRYLIKSLLRFALHAYLNMS